MSVNLRTPITALLPRRNSLQGNDLLSWRWRQQQRQRQRLKATPMALIIRNSQLGLPFHNFVSDLISHFPSANSLDLIAPALGFASGVGLYMSRLNKTDNEAVDDEGEWMLFTSPTPFNRFVLLRCPSLSFTSEMLVDEDGKLVKEGRHLVRLDSGRIHARNDRVMTSELVDNLEYQRLCVPTGDGGVISLDWPANLNLQEEHGLDATLLLIPGTPQGSMDNHVQMLVSESLKRGFFPVVINPRGCAASPITSPRIFTAADSDDVHKAVQFISKIRPWTTVMGVGWGYGANMLSKYLAELGEKTPIIAATCIDTPFDLEEATRTPQLNLVHQNLLDGLKDILRSNKEIFRGRTKGFDVEKALLAESFREFDTLISMISSGFTRIEDFYSNCSAECAVSNIKIPLLFIQSSTETQSSTGTVPFYPVPRSLIAENPYTSMLLCSCIPFNQIASSRLVMPWWLYTTIEWLTAVEHGLLKGRHPLLENVDITINPSRNLSLSDGSQFGEGGEANENLKFKQRASLDGYSVDPINDVHVRPPIATNVVSNYDISTTRNSGLEGSGLLQIDHIKLGEGSFGGSNLVTGNGGNAMGSGRGHGLETAQVVMNMLDVAMPGLLTQEQKEKVLGAVSQGETVLKALQDAVPEDVRGKLTTAVSDILHSGEILNLDVFLYREQNNLPSGPRSVSSDKLGVTSSSEAGDGSSSRNSSVSGVNLENGSLLGRKNLTRNNDSDVHQQGGGETFVHSQSVGLADQDAESVSNGLVDGGVKEAVLEDNFQLSPEDQNALSFAAGQNAGSISKGLVDCDGGGKLALAGEKSQLYRSKNPAYVDQNKNVNTNTNMQSSSGAISGNKESLFDHNQQNQASGTPELAAKEDNHTKDVGAKALAPSEDQNAASPSADPCQEASSSKSQLKNDFKEEREEKGIQPVQDSSNTGLPNVAPPTFNLSEAFDALTGMDDSTQVAVNSVFGVIEDMITQLEDKDDSGKDLENVQNLNDGRPSLEEKEALPEAMGENFHGMIIQSPPSVETHKILSLNAISGNKGMGSDPVRNGNYSCTSQHDLSENPPREHYLGNNPISNVHGAQVLDMDATMSLLLDYCPEEGHWKFLKQDSGDSHKFDRFSLEAPNHFHGLEEIKETIVRSPHVRVDTTESQHRPIGDPDKEDAGFKDVEIKHGKLKCFVKSIIKDSLIVEVSRRLIASDVAEMNHKLTNDFELIANAVAKAVQDDNIDISASTDTDLSFVSGSKNFGNLHAEHIVTAISLTAQRSHYLRRVIPVGVIVGSSLATLKKFFNVVVGHPNAESESPSVSMLSHQKVDHVREKVNLKVCDQASKKPRSAASECTDSGQAIFQNDSVVGAVAAALSASTILMQDSYKGADETKKLPNSINETNYGNKVPKKLMDGIPESQNNLVTSLAEKAMTVAGPVVPMTDSGAVDQERLVAMLAELGQRGGLLKLVGKVALLWGGLRGALSLTDKLITFLRLSERNIFQRIIGFAGMVILLWSPVCIPLLPTLLRGWATKSPSRVVELTCIVGLYLAVALLIMLWGKRVRGYDRPLEQYGLDFTISQFQSFLKAYIGGIFIVLSIQYVYTVLGCASLSWKTLSPPLNLSWLKAFGKIVVLAAQGTVSATGVVLVEELLFRSWLPAEIFEELGYHRGVIIAGFTFSILQRSLHAVPGLWLLSLALAGLKERNQGRLSSPVGLRAGMMATNFFLQKGGFLIYRPNLPLWIKGTHPFQPLSGIAGLACSLLLAVFLYPRRQNYRMNMARKIRE